MMRDCVHFPPCAEYADVEKRCNPGCQFYCPGENVEVVAVSVKLLSSNGNTAKCHSRRGRQRSWAESLTLMFRVLTGRGKDRRTPEANHEH